MLQAHTGGCNSHAGTHHTTSCFSLDIGCPQRQPLINVALQRVVLASRFSANNVAHRMEQSLVVGRANATNLWETGGDSITSNAMEGLRPPDGDQTKHEMRARANEARDEGQSSILRSCSPVVFGPVDAIYAARTIHEELGLLVGREIAHDGLDPGFDVLGMVAPHGGLARLVDAGGSRRQRARAAEVEDILWSRSGCHDEGTSDELDKQHYFSQAPTICDADAGLTPFSVLFFIVSAE